MTRVLEDIQATKIVAIVRMEHYAQAREIARALLAGGISLIEFTLTGKGALQAIAAAREACGGAAVIGVGTVLDPRMATEAVVAGAQFVVTPVTRVEIIEACRTADVPIFCGAFTPTEALTAHEAGAEFIKIFPARLGGPQYIRDILAPLPQLRLVPTGGISLENARAYTEAGAVAVGIGGNLVSAQAVASGDWAQITAKARSYVEALK
jgi:2-dehydro-3-deoxyphosphogluconate aldolase / (4S)-4-hydroxy-2-oxoglutarate aldolase